ncbi:hypothetical protein [Sedimenticola sp.]|uniref:hypothetical protein n=1 Tax=Sedimenticola sp. TaxID=1940285 RepID=UPI003D148541
MAECYLTPAELTLMRQAIQRPIDLLKPPARQAFFVASCANCLFHNRQLALSTEAVDNSVKKPLELAAKPVNHCIFVNLTKKLPALTIS